MRCQLHLQSTGIINFPASVDFGAAQAISLRVQVEGFDLSILVGVSRWRARRWCLLPLEVRELCGAPKTLDVDLSPLETVIAAREILPHSGLVRFRAVVIGQNDFVVAVPLVWYRGMRRLGWSRRVEVVVQDGPAVFHFVRELSVRGAAEQTVTLALPRTACPSIMAADEVVVELRPAPPVVPLVLERTPTMPPAVREPPAVRNPRPWAEIDDYLARFPVSSWKEWDAARQERELQGLLAAHRDRGFPWDIVRAQTEQAPLSRVRNSSVKVEGDLIKSVGYSGQNTCRAAHAHRLSASYGSNPSVAQAFDTDRVLRRALRLQLKYGDPVTPGRVLRALSAVVKGPLNFPPALARWIVDTYAPTGGTVLDPCSGYGGRMLGTLASYREAKYIGADIERQSALANVALAQALGVADRVQQFVRPVEDPDAWPAADLVLTGPPYYNRERYGDAARAALTQYPTYRSWVDGFLRTLLSRSATAAPIIVVNVAPLRDGALTYDLPADVVTQGAAVGAHLERTLTWQTAKFGRARAEKILVLRR